jgi:NAD(P)-dependent dehydrogenase (short-subunit alcohol dehydrogenase family)
MMTTLTGKIAVVTGASRGVGRGVALGLGEAGATVYVTGRSTGAGRPEENLPGAIAGTAAAVTAAGGMGIALPCDHRRDEDVEAAFGRVLREDGRIDILVNNAWGGYEYIDGVDGAFTWLNPFWEQPRWRWDAMFQAGVRAAFVASAIAARAMVAQGSGLIVNISYWAAQTYMNNLMYGVAKAATDRLAADMAYELRPHNVAAVSLYPGLVRTERVLRNAQYFDMSNAESPQFSGRAVAALAGDPDVMSKSGQVLVAAALALEYGFTDVDGKQPRPLTLADVIAGADRAGRNEAQHSTES